MLIMLLTYLAHKEFSVVLFWKKLTGFELRMMKTEKLGASVLAEIR